MERSFAHVLIAIVLSVVLSVTLTLAAVATGTTDSLSAAISGTEIQDDDAAFGDMRRDMNELSLRLADIEDAEHISDGSGGDDSDAIGELRAQNASLRADVADLRARIDELAGLIAQFAPGSVDSNGNGAGALDLSELDVDDPAFQAVINRLAESMRATAEGVYEAKQLQERIDRVANERKRSREMIEGVLPRIAERYNANAAESGANPIDEYTLGQVTDAALGHHDKETELRVTAIREGWEDEQRDTEMQVLNQDFEAELGTLLDEQQMESLGGFLTRGGGRSFGRGGSRGGGWGGMGDGR